MGRRRYREEPRIPHGATDLAPARRSRISRRYGVLTINILDLRGRRRLESMSVLVYTSTLYIDRPFGLMPVCVMVRTLRSFETSRLSVRTTLPSFFTIASTVCLSTRLRVTVSPYGEPVTG